MIRSNNCSARRKRPWIAGSLLAAFAGVAFVSIAASPAVDDPLDRTALEWDIAASLGLPGGLSPEQFAPGKPPIPPAEEIVALQDNEKSVRETFKKVLALYRVYAQGGDADVCAQFAFEWSMAQARLAWVERKDAVCVVARLEQAEKMADLWIESHVGYSTAVIDWQESLAAQNAKFSTTAALARVRAALTRLGYDLSEVAKAPQFDLKKDEVDNWKPK